jgi:Tfp pilus assembly protein PilF
MASEHPPEYTKPLTEESEKLTEKGVYLLTFGKWAEAEKKFSQALVKEPQNGRAYLGLGESLFHQQKSAEAIQVFQQGLAIIPPASACAYALTHIFIDQQKFDQADEYLRQYMRLEPNRAAAFLLKAQVLMAKIQAEMTVDKQEIKAALDMALQLAPTSVKVHDALARYYEQVEDNPAKAKEFYYAALKLDPSNESVHHNYADFLFSTGQTEEAEAEFITALRLNPALHDSERGLTRTKSWIGKLMKFFARFLTFFERHENSAWFLALLMILYITVLGPLELIGWILYRLRLGFKRLTTFFLRSTKG